VLDSVRGVASRADGIATIPGMHLVLALSDLVALADDATPAHRAPGLARLLAVAGVPAIEDGTIATALASHYGVERQTDWPLAPIRLATLGVDPGGAFWLSADPVTLVVGRDDVRLGGIVDDLGRDDADALVDTLNRHFAGDGVAFTAPRPDAFFARVVHRPRIATHPLSAASSASLRVLSLAGPDADIWQRWQSEIQMLLHEHPVNLRREREGRPPANSVWFSGGGTLPPRPGSAASIITFANDGIAVALAAHAGAPARELPPGLAPAMSAATSAASMVVAFDAPLDWTAIDTAWLAPARDALMAGTLASVTLLTDVAGAAVAWTARRPGFWRRLAGRRAQHDLSALLAPARNEDRGA
jgi:hypothetical protein